MKAFKKLSWLLLGMASLGLAGVVLAQVSPNFDLHWSLLNSGGGERQSTNARLQDSLGQWAGGTASSANHRIEGGFWPGVARSTPGPTPSPGDSYEPDNACTQAYTVVPNGATQTHTFHIPGDQDWVRFTAPNNRTYILEASNTGAKADPIALAYDTCNTAPPPLGGADNPFGPSLQLEWNGIAGVTYYIKLTQHDPSVAGTGTNYDLTVSEDVARAQPALFPRCAAKSSTTLALQAGDKVLSGMWWATKRTISSKAAAKAAHPPSRGRAIPISRLVV